MTTAVIETEAHPSVGLNIYQIIDRISNEAGALAPESKGGVPFAFRGIDGTVAHLSPLLRKYGVVVVPTVLEHKVSSVPSGNKVVTTSEILTQWFFYAPDGTSIEAITAGLANDYADRSAAQAQSVAFRVALLQTFALPTHTPEPEQTGVEPEAPAQQTYVPPTREAEPIRKGREAIKALANERDVDYVALGNSKFEKGWPERLEDLKTLYKAIEAGETA